MVSTSLATFFMSLKNDIWHTPKYQPSAQSRFGDNPKIPDIKNAKWHVVRWASPLCTGVLGEAAEEGEHLGELSVLRNLGWALDTFFLQFLNILKIAGGNLLWHGCTLGILGYVNLSQKMLLPAVPTTLASMYKHNIIIIQAPKEWMGVMASLLLYSTKRETRECHFLDCCSFPVPSSPSLEFLHVSDLMNFGVSKLPGHTTTLCYE